MKIEMQENKSRKKNPHHQRKSFFKQPLKTAFSEPLSALFFQNVHYSCFESFCLLPAAAAARVASWY